MMKEDILKFRKLCDTLIKEKDYTVNKIVIESGITWPTMKTLREAPINDIKIMASILGRIQDFIHKHCEDITYSGIKSEKSFVEQTEEEAGKQMLIEQENVIMAGQRTSIIESNVRSVKEQNLKIKSVKRQKKDKNGFVKSDSEVKPEDLFNKKESDIPQPGKIPAETKEERNLHIPTVQEILDEVPFWKLIASAHRRLPEGIVLKVEISKKS